VSPTHANHLSDRPIVLVNAPPLPHPQVPTSSDPPGKHVESYTQHTKQPVNYTFHEMSGQSTTDENAHSRSVQKVRHAHITQKNAV
jgi:anaerobic ribonucleoside-triphosphate reductase